MSKNYEVGHGKPPKQHQWKKGQSGNPSGKRKQSKKTVPFMDYMAEALSEEVDVTINGKRQKVPIGQLFAKTLLKEAIASSPKVKLEILEKLHKLGVFDIQSYQIAEMDTDCGSTFTEEHRRMLEILKDEVNWDAGSDGLSEAE